MELPKFLKQGLMQLKGFILKHNWVILVCVSYYLALGTEFVNQDLTL